MIVFMRKYWAVGIIILAWMVFAYPYFLQNKIPYPAVFQNTFFSPWSEYPELSMPVKNNALSDVVTQIYPWKNFTIEELKKGSIPWWNPYSFSGNPHAANFQSAVFSPFNLLYFVLPFINAWTLIIIIQPLLAGIFMYLFLKSLKLSSFGSVIGSGAFMFCGFMVVWMPYGTMSMAILFLPLALYAIEKYLTVKNNLYLLLLALTVPLSFFSGHIQTSFYFFITIFAYGIYRLYTAKKTKHLPFLMLSIVSGLFISLLQIFPTWEIYLLSARASEGYLGGAIPWQYLITIIAPDFYGNPVTRNEWVGHYAEWAGFAGAATIFLALLSFHTKNKVIPGFFAALGAAGLILAVESPFQLILINSGIPILSNSIPSRAIVLFSFAAAVLGAIGADVLRKYLDDKNYKKIMIPLVFYVIFIIAVWLILIMRIMPEDKSITAARNFAVPTAFVFVIAVIIATSAIVKKKMLNNLALYSLVIISFAGGLMFVIKWMPYDSREHLSPQLPVIKTMQDNLRGGRVFGKIGSYIDANYKIPSIEGYDPLYNRRYGEFVEGAKTGKPAPAVRSLAVLDKNAKYADRVLDLLGVTVIYHVIGDTNKTWAYPVWDERFFDKYKIVYSDDKFQVYNNLGALPRAKLFFDYEVIEDDREIIRRFYDEGFDFRNKIILEKKPNIMSKVKSQKSKEDSVNGIPRVIIEKYTPNYINITVDIDMGGLLFLSDSFYPKWRARVNGIDAEIYRANYAFRAVEIKPGKSVVEFNYDPLKTI